MEPDPATANSRRTGGLAGRHRGESAATTGPGHNDAFVGRVGGADAGYSGETGAEARSLDEDAGRHRRGDGS